MGKTGKWIRSFLTGKKDKDKEKEKEKALASGNDQNPATTPISTLPTTPKEKKRWSFRRSSASGGSGGAKEGNGVETSSTVLLPLVGSFDSENEQKKHAMAMAAATAAAADAAAAAAQAAAAVIRLTAAANGRSDSAVEESAAIKIQSVFRSYLARKALCALKGLVKLQALVRGHLVRKQATATLRCMQALVTAQARARAQRLRIVEEPKSGGQRNSIHRKSTKENRFSNANHESDVGTEENIKIVEMDMGDYKGSTKSRNSYSHQLHTERGEHRLSSYYGPNHGGYSNPEACRVSPAPSALTEMSPRAYSGHFEDYSINTTQSSPQYYSAVSKPDPSRIPLAFPRPEYAESMAYDYPLYPNYMANTESSRAKVRSQSAPKQRPPDSYERQPSRRRASIEGRNVPRSMKMQRSSSHVGTTAQNYQFPWALKLDRSTVSLKDSECGSTSTVLTNTNYCRSLVGFDVNGDRY